MKILVSAGEASGDFYAAQLVSELQKRFPNARFFGCAGRRLRAAGVEPVVRSEELAVVGVFEVLAHIPGIFRRLQRVIRRVKAEKPDFALLTDSPQFHLEMAKRLHRMKIPTFFYIAPQVWAWRRGRIRLLRKFVDHLLCIFPFEEQFFRENGVLATYVGHPLSDGVRTTVSRTEYFARHGLDPNLPLAAILPGSRKGEAERHLPALREAVRRLREWRAMNFVLPASSTTGQAFFAERVADSSVQVTEEGAHDALGHADIALIASGTATVEAAMLGVPMVVFYRVSFPTWVSGKLLVNTPFYSMVNLLAGRRIVPELIQSDCTGARLAAEARRLLEDESLRGRMRQDLAAVAASLRAEKPAAERAVEVICEKLQWTAASTKAAKDSLAVS